MISENVSKVKKIIDESNASTGNNTVLVGVTKNRSIEEIRELVAAGVYDLGENRVQEFTEKYPYFENDNVRWHIIGSLQKNKVKYIIGKVFLIHSIDSIELLAEINRQSLKFGVITDVLLETNVSGEDSKHGFAPGELYKVLSDASAFSSVRVKGIMTMAPADANEDSLEKIFSETINIFHELMKEAQKYDNITMKYLSMGMSRDFKTALKCGSNMVRLGTILFS